jgi:hypothetical protein
MLTGPPAVTWFTVMSGAVLWTVKVPPDVAVRAPVAEMKTCAAGETTTPADVMRMSPGAVASASACCWAAVRFPDWMSASGMVTDAAVWPMLPPVTRVTLTPEMFGMEIPTGIPFWGSSATSATGFISSFEVQSALLLRLATCCAVATYRKDGSYVWNSGRVCQPGPKVWTKKLMRDWYCEPA